MTPPTAPRAEVLISDPRWRAALGNVDRLVRQACRMVQLHAAPFPEGAAPPAFAFSDDRHVKQLNARFRGRNRPTNVLTFEPPSPLLGGDVVLAYQTMAREARQARKTLREHTAHLLVHGLLHLAGHDHHHPGEARRMEGLETLILRRMGFADPWRTRRPSHDPARLPPSL